MAWPKGLLCHFCFHLLLEQNCNKSLGTALPVCLGMKGSQTGEQVCVMRCLGMGGSGLTISTRLVSFSVRSPLNVKIYAV